MCLWSVFIPNFKFLISLAIGCCCLIESPTLQSHRCDSIICHSTKVMMSVCNVYSSELRYDIDVSSCQLCITLYCAFHCPTDQTLHFFHYCCFYFLSSDTATSPVEAGDLNALFLDNSKLVVAVVPSCHKQPLVIPLDIFSKKYWVLLLFVINCYPVIKCVVTDELWVSTAPTPLNQTAG